MRTAAQGDGLRASVIIAAFNAERTIYAAVHSALSQSEKSIEIIVVDDSSSDATVEIVKGLELKDQRVVLLENRGPQGPSAARNTALRQASGDWLVILDADDTIVPLRIEQLTKEAEARNLDMLADNLCLIQHNTGLVLGRAFPEGMMRRERPIDLRWLLEHDIPGGNHLTFGFAKPIINRKSIAKTGIKYDEDIRMAEDFLLSGNLINAGLRFGLSSSTGYNYTREAPSLTAGLRNSDQIIKVNERLRSNWLDLLDGPSVDHAELEVLFRTRAQAFRYEDLVYAVRRRDLTQLTAALGQLSLVYVLQRLGRAVVRRLNVHKGLRRSGD